MRRPGSIATLSSLAAAIIGVGATSGAARISGSAPSPPESIAPTEVIVDRDASLPEAVTTPIVVTESEVPAAAPEVVDDVGREMIAAAVTPARPVASTAEIVFEPLPVAASIELERPVPPPVASDGPGRRRPASNATGLDDGRTVSPGRDPSIGERRYFNGRPIRAVKTMRMRVTAYSPDHRSCGVHADGITASGYSVEANAGRLVAADRRLFPFGSLVTVPGYAGGQVVPVLDRGGAIKGSRLDVLYPTHDIARRWGVRNVDVVVWEYADGEPIGFRRPKGR